MSACNLMERCSFFKNNMAEMPSTAEVIKMRYCRGRENAVCARYLVSESLGMEKVPPDLLPNQMDRIAEILDDV